MKLLLIGHPSNICSVVNNSKQTPPNLNFGTSGGFVVNLPDPQTGENRHYLYIPNNHGVESYRSDGDKGEIPETPGSFTRSVDENAINAQDPGSATNTQKEQKLSAGNIYEIQNMQNSNLHSNATNKSYGSYFVDSTVISDGSLCICSPLDPLYFVLPYVSEHNNNKWMPLDQVISTFSGTIQNALCTYQLKNLMDFKQLGDDEDDLLLCRYNESKTIVWLKSKYMLCVEGIRKKMLQHQQKKLSCHEGSNQHGAFAPGFIMDSVTSLNSSEDTTAIANSNSSEELELHNAAKRYALQVLFEYLNEVWRKKILLSLGFPDDYSLEQTKSAPSNTIPSAVITPLHEYDDKKRKPVEPAKTYGQKKLAKVDTKGMKSLSSFFSSSTSSKKKK
jgi:ribonuclease H2 subunit B